jgi:tetratricopeptide (TPR) repeat protein
MGDKMTYRVALDDREDSKNGKMAETWMQAAGQNGIPAAFLVNKHRKIAWIGHPMTLKDTLIEEILADTYDLKKAAADYAKRSDAEQKLRSIMQKLMKSMRAKNWDEAETVLNDAEKLLPADETDGLAMYRLRVLTGKNDLDAAYALVRKLSEKDPDNAMLQNDLAWTIATSPDIKKRDLDLAETIARRGTAASKEKNPAVLDTLARVLFMKGEKQEAIQVQKKAVELAQGSMKTRLKKVLDSYEADQLPDDPE